MTTPALPENGPTHWRDALAIVAAAVVVRLLLAACIPLVPDEAYYWEWSRHLAAGYFDHPPVIAWLIAGGTRLFGDHALAIRFFPILAGGIGMLALVQATRELANARAARFAAVLLAVMPLTIGLAVATPDAPLFGALGLCLLALLRALRATAPRAQLGWWALVGVTIGVAIVSKLSAVVVPFAALAAVPLVPVLRAQLRTAGPWVAVAIAAAVLAPTLAWNAQHDWIAFRFQLSHGLGDPQNGSVLGRELLLVAGQLGVVSPILAVLLAMAVWRGLRRVDSAPRGVFAVIALGCLVFFAVSATRKPVEANWPAIAWLPAVVLLAAERAGERTRWERWGAMIAAGLSLLVLAQALIPFLPIEGRRDPTVRGHGWAALAEAINQQEVELSRLSGNVHVAANRYQDAAMLAYHLPGHPEVYSLNMIGRHNQYDFWPSFPARASAGHSLVLVSGERSDTLDPAAIRALRPHFERVESIERLSLRRGGEEYAARRLWVLRNWRGTWPADSTR